MLPMTMAVCLALVGLTCRVPAFGEAAGPPGVGSHDAGLEGWAIAGFARPAEPRPVIQPDPSSLFLCPLQGRPLAWEALHTFNPGAVVQEGKVCVLYRAEDRSGAMRVGGHTSRLGLATSEDGIRFQRRPQPVLFPANDDQKEFEWTGGCEDPRLAEGPDGTYVMTYTQYNGHAWRLGLATSRDLVNWTKHGSPFAGTPYERRLLKSAAIVHRVVDGRLVAAKVGGKYWMYFGENAVHVATSGDLISWTPLERAPGELLCVMTPRPGRFDSELTEVGPQLVQTDRGIILIYNGKNRDPGAGGDPDLPGGVYSCGQALFSDADPTRLIARLDKPFFKPELAWEKTGQYAAGTTFAQGLVLLRGRWFLYYGCADTFVGVASAPALP